MTAQRPYRMTPLTAEQALGELRKFAGIQFDPVVVDAFVRTAWVDGVPDPGRPVPRPIPLIAQAANRMTQATAQNRRPSSAPDPARATGRPGARPAQHPAARARRARWSSDRLRRSLDADRGLTAAC